MEQTEYCVVLLMVILVSVQNSLQLASEDYCEDETFTAQCDDNEVILMTQAIYGRMKVVRCITGRSGCSYDILSIMDQKCSGRRRCEVDIRDLFVAIPQSICDRNLRNYLQAAYTCLRVAVPPTKRCYKTPVQIEATSGGHIASYVTAETGCGNYDAPWLIKVEPGQRINVTLFDFGTASNLNDETDKTCQVLTVIKDTVVGSSKTVCSGTQRIREEFLSRANEIEIRIIAGLTDGSEEDRTHFVLQYDVYGCADLTVNSDTTFRRINDGIAELSCISSGDSWRVKCKGTKWDGHVKNCTEGSGGSGSLAASTSLSLFSLPSGLSVAIVIIIAVLIGLVILTVGLVMIRRRRLQHGDNPVAEIRHPKYDLDYSSSHACHYEATAPDSLYKANDHFGNAYYRTWELQRRGPQPQGVGAHGSSLPPITPSETYGPDSEHIYESPKSLRREIRAADPALQYYELDPNSPDDSSKGKFPAV